MKLSQVSGVKTPSQGWVTHVGPQDLWDVPPSSYQTPSHSPGLSTRYLFIVSSLNNSLLWAQKKNQFDIIDCQIQKSWNKPSLLSG